MGVCPESCHLTDLAGRLTDRRYAMTVAHGDVDGAVRAISEAAKRGALMPSDQLKQLADEFSQERLRKRFVQVVESAAAVTR
jgi:hypothetical protein